MRKLLAAAVCVLTLATVTPVRAAEPGEYTEFWRQAEALELFDGSPTYWSDCVAKPWEFHADAAPALTDGPEEWRLTHRYNLWRGDPNYYIGWLAEVATGTAPAGVMADFAHARWVIAETLSCRPALPTDGCEAAGLRPGYECANGWRPLIAEHFPPEWVEWAVRIVACESRGQWWAANPRSSARGLFQHLGRFWTARSAAAGWPGADILDPEANVAVAAWLLLSQESRRPGSGVDDWVCRATRHVP